MTEKQADLETMKDTILQLEVISIDLKKTDIHNHYILDDCIEEIKDWIDELKYLKYGFNADI